MSANKTKPEAVATIELDREDCARGTIRVEHTTEGWEVDCLTPEGERLEGNLPAFETRDLALDAIEETWGALNVWKLQWIEATS